MKTPIPITIETKTTNSAIVFSPFETPNLERIRIILYRTNSHTQDWEIFDTQKTKQEKRKKKHVIQLLANLGLCTLDYLFMTKKKEKRSSKRKFWKKKTNKIKKAELVVIEFIITRKEKKLAENLVFCLKISRHFFGEKVISCNILHEIDEKLAKRQSKTQIGTPKQSGFRLPTKKEKQEMKR